MPVGGYVEARGLSWAAANFDSKVVESRAGPIVKSSILVGYASQGAGDDLD
jgi:hypothetical protein